MGVVVGVAILIAAVLGFLVVAVNASSHGRGRHDPRSRGWGGGGHSCGGSSCGSNDSGGSSGGSSCGSSCGGGGGGD